MRNKAYNIDSRPIPADEAAPAEERPRRPRINIPVSKIVSVRQNQTGISYKSLFGDYLRTAHRVVIVDPYLVWDFQKYNLMEFIQTVYDCSANKDELSIHLSTKNETESVDRKSACRERV